MIDKLFEWNIDGIQANTVLEGAEVTIPIDEANYKDIFLNNELVKKLDYCDNTFRIILYNKNSKLYRSILDEIHLSYMSKKGMYYIGFNYKEIFTNLLLKLGVNKDMVESMELPTNITNTNEAHLFMDKIEKVISDNDELPFEVTPENIDKYKMLNILSTNLKRIIKLMVSTEYSVKNAIDVQVNEERNLRSNHKDLKNIKNKNVSWKNLMYYTGVKSLLKYVKTGDMNYYRYVKNFYKNVSTNAKIEKPKAMKIDKIYFDCRFNTFNEWFEDVRSYNFPEILVKLDIEDRDTITFRETLKRGNGMKGTITGVSTPKKKVDYSKISDTLDRKIKFYRGLEGKVQGIIKGFDTDTDYIGFVLNNNYVVFDKFYELSKDGTKANPAYGNRVYVVTLDVLEACGRNKQRIRDYISKNHDFKAFNYNHTDTDSYQDRVKEVLDYYDISPVKYKELKLKYEGN